MNHARLTILSMAVVLAMPLWCGAGTNFVSSFREGTYKGHVVSVDPRINDTEAMLNLTREGNTLSATVTLADGVETWEWDASRLTHVELDGNRKPLRTYTATAAGRSSDAAQEYAVDCSRTGSCSVDIDPRHRWSLETNGDSITYSVYGVPAEKWGDAGAVASSRHVMRFTPVRSDGAAKLRP